MRILKMMRKNYMRKAIVYTCTGCMMFNTSLLLATPTNPTVVAGTATAVAGNTTTVNVLSNKAIINWDSLDTSSSQVLQFLKAGGGNFAVLNRVMNGGATHFDGKLLGNQGNIIVINSKGVVFGPTALIDARKFTASSLNMLDKDFINGDTQNPENIKYQFTSDNAGDVTVLKGADIKAQLVSLVGKNVLNQGTITTGPDGYVVITAGDDVYMGWTNSDVTVKIANNSNSSVRNEGSINAPQGNICLAAGDAFSQAMNLGNINAASGNVSITGQTTTLASGSSIDTSAGQNGDGGKVSIHGSKSAVLENGASIEAKGGSESGNGGFVEVSCKRLAFAGNVDTTAAYGYTGTLLLAPHDIYIKNGDGIATADSIYEKNLENQLTNVTIEVVTSIIMENLSDNELALVDKNILMRTGPIGSIHFIDTSDTLTTNGCVIMGAGSRGIHIGNIVTGEANLEWSPGPVVLYTNHGGNINTGYLNSFGGSEVLISVISDGDLTIDGILNPNGAVLAKTNSIPQADIANSQVCLQAKGNININYAVESEAHGKLSTIASTIINAGEKVNIDTGSGQIISWANTANKNGTAESLVKIYAGSDASDAIVLTGTGNDPLVRSYANTDQGDLSDLTSNGATTDNKLQKNGLSTALIEILNAWTGQCPDCPKPTSPPTTPPPKPTPTPTPVPNAIPVLIKPVEFAAKGCPLLLETAAKELGVAKSTIQISVAKSMASNPNIQFCDSCAKLIDAANTLKDVDGSRMKALASLVNQLAAPDMPPSPEQMTMIADTLAGHSGDGTQYASAREYLDAMVAYVNVLNKDMDSPVGDSITFVMQKYGKALTESGNPNLAAYVEQHLAAMSK